MAADVTRVRTVCGYCGVGCGMVLDVARQDDGPLKVIKVSGDRDHPANAGRLCTKGATGAELLAGDQRVAGVLAVGDGAQQRELVAGGRGVDRGALTLLHGALQRVAERAVQQRTILERVADGLFERAGVARRLT